jgi:hypothetical protein
MGESEEMEKRSAMLHTMLARRLSLAATATEEEKHTVLTVHYPLILLIAEINVFFLR